MVARRSLVLVLAGAFASMGASFPTTNFQVDAPTAEIAKRVGQYAEHYRKEKAVQWLGKEMPPWPQRCPLQVTVTSGGAGGATTFDYRNNQVFSQSMHIEGSLDRLLDSVLPHEITHTVFAYHFRRPVPRWADEGGSVLSEDDLERNRHDGMVRQILGSGHGIPLRRLFSLKDYPSDVMALYAQGYSVSSYLVGLSSRPAFLNFVADGMETGWEQAVQSHYHLNSVNELEQAWIQHLRETRGQRGAVARGTRPAEAETASRVVVRQTAPPVQPLAESPRAVYRGQSGTEGDRRPEYLPDARPTGTSGTADGDRWQSRPARQSENPAVRLGSPEPVNQPAVQLGAPLPGYPR